MVELRKRKSPPATSTNAPKRRAEPKVVSKKPQSALRASPKEENVTQPQPEDTTTSTEGFCVPKVGDSLELDSFGGTVQTHDGTSITLHAMAQGSKSGVVLFTYPKASTPGCTTQACLFRDGFEALTATGFAIYGLSNDSPKSNTTFKTKQNLPYTLLCDPKATLIGAIGFKKKPKGTQRGVFVVDSKGIVLAAEAGGPARTVEIVRQLVQS